MEFQNKIKSQADRIESLKSNTKTEEATKNAFVMPFLQILGYDIFNPTEVIPEFVADVGIKKGEKVDYAIMLNGEPIMIIECKHWKENLDKYSSQLHRYFHVTKARFGVLTNGVKFRFFTDLEENNKMDEEPFLEFDFANIKEMALQELKKFEKTSFDVDKIIDSASELKYTMAVRCVLDKELTDPSEEFVRLFTKQIYDGKLTAKIVEQFTEIVKRAVNQSFKEIVNERLRSALQKETEEVEEVVDEDGDTKIVTTEEEIEGFHIVRAIVRKKVDAARIYGRDTQSYFGILLDDNNRKPICRLHFNAAQKYLGVFDGDKKEERISIESLDDIYNYSDRLMETASNYEE